MRQRRIGELAKATGLTVRTLHHYDEIGLLVPSERSCAGYRLYGDAEIRRLYRILALRGMGFSLEDVGATIDGEGDDPRPVVQRQLERIDRQLSQTARLRDRLTRILDLLDRVDEPSGDLFIDAIEVMTAMEQYYTPEQLDQLDQRRRALGEAGVERAEQDWADLIAEVEAARAAGTDRAEPGVQALMVRWNGLIEQFTGGDPGIRASLKRHYEDAGVERASRGAIDAETMAYVQRAMAVREERSD